MATNLRGVMAALLTPFDQQQALDKASLRRLVQFNIQQGIDGLYVGGSTGEALYRAFQSVNRYWKSSLKRRKVRLNSSPTSVASAPPKANNLRHRLNVMASMPSPPSRRSTILSALKNTAITIGQLLIRRMGCRWWCTTFQPERGKTDPGSDQHPGYAAWCRCAETDLWRSLSDGADPS